MRMVIAGSGCSERYMLSQKLLTPTMEESRSRNLPPTMVSEYNLKLIDKKSLQKKLKE